MVIATTYTSNYFHNYEDVPQYSELYPKIIEKIKDFCKSNGIIHNEEKEINYKSTKITYSIFYSPQNQYFFLSFRPENVWQWSSKKVLSPALNNTIEFFNMLPASIELDNISFSKTKVSGSIDISDWNFTTEPDLGYNKISEIASLRTIRSIGSGIFNHYRRTIEKKLIVIDATDNRYKNEVDDLVNRISPLFKENEYQLKYSDHTLEEIGVRMDKHNLFVLLFRDNLLFNDDDYRRFKLFLISNDIPSQIINIVNYNTITSWGFENLIFEILKKIFQKDIISLNPVSTSKIDGFLCLSDIGEIKNNKIFGVSISYTGKGATEDWLEIYNDIKYEANIYNIYFEKDDIYKLSNKISVLTNLVNSVIDIFVTKRWKLRDVGLLIKYLNNEDIYVRRFLYISKRTNRFLFDTLKDEIINVNKNPYIIWDGKVASILTNSKLQLYGTLFPLYIELLNPWTSGDLTVSDLEEVLWLVKKRIYRIMNFYNLKLPEILVIFEDVKNLTLHDLPYKLKINLNLLI